MPLVSCPACGASVSDAAPACPRCGHPRPGASAARPGARPSQGDRSAGWLLFGILAAFVLVVGLLGIGVYRVVQRVGHPVERRPEEIVDFVDSAETESRRPPVGGPAAGRTLPPDDSTLELSAVEVQPELANREEVQANLSRNYPPLLRDAGVTGTVTLRMRIRSDGSVDTGSITVEQATHDAFSQAAAAVVARMRFRPARLNGRPVPVWVTLPVTFQLAT